MTTTDAMRDQSLTGAAGTALLHIARARAGTGRWEDAHQAVRVMIRRPVVAHPAVSNLYRGAPAVAFVLRLADRSEYTPTLAVLDRHIDRLTRHRLDAAHQRIDRADLPALREYDLISGLTGIGAYLLHRHSDAELRRPPGAASVSALPSPSTACGCG